MTMTTAPSASVERMSCADHSLYHLGLDLQAADYHFTTMTPAGHAIVNSRPENQTADDFVGVFGWNRPFAPDLIPSVWLERMRVAQVVEKKGDLLCSRIRFSSLDDHLILHSGFPTSQHDAVFFGPDTYRFARLLQRYLPSGVDLLELGSGSGAAAICVASRFQKVVLSDINPTAARYAAINLALARVAESSCVVGDLFSAAPGAYSAIIANPPYMIDPSGRWYRDGGGNLGIELALRMVREGLEHLRTGGSLIVYTGTPVIAGRDRFKEAVSPLLEGTGIPFAYEELDVDVFSEELAEPAYAGIDRIAVVAVLVGNAVRKGAHDEARGRSASGSE